MRTRLGRPWGRVKAGIRSRGIGTTPPIPATPPWSGEGSGTCQDEVRFVNRVSRPIWRISYTYKPWSRFGHGFGHDCQSASISLHVTRSVKISCVRQAVMILDHTQSWSVAVSLGETTGLRAAGSSPAGRTTGTSLGHPDGLLATNDFQPWEDPPPRISSGPMDLHPKVTRWV